MIEDLDVAVNRLCASGWAAKPRDRFGDMDAEQRAMAAKLLAPPTPAVIPSSCTWFWTANTLGRQWRIREGGMLMCRGFSAESLNAQLRLLRADGYVIERGTDILGVAA